MANLLDTWLYEDNEEYDEREEQFLGGESVLYHAPSHGAVQRRVGNLITIPPPPPPPQEPMPQSTMNNRAQYGYGQYLQRPVVAPQRRYSTTDSNVNQAAAAGVVVATTFASRSSHVMGENAVPGNTASRRPSQSDLKAAAAPPHSSVATRGNLIRPMSPRASTVMGGGGGGSLDAKMVLERKLQEALDREKHQQLQINELKRKMAGLEERVRVVKTEKRKMERRHVESLEARVLASVQRVVQDRECDAELKDKIADAVAHVVAQTLLNAQTGASVVAPPRRLPPTAATTTLMHI